MSQIKQIAEGWKNVIFKKDDVEQVATVRLDICNNCEWHSKNSKAKLKRPDDHCTKCGCPLMSKTRCMSCSCPDDRWFAIADENEQEGSKEG
jgi:hypothetical protein